MENKKALLVIEDLSVEFKTKRGPLRAVSDVTLTVHENESLAVIGESGSGKTTLATAIVDILPLNGSVTAGSISYLDEKGSHDLLRLTKAQFRRLLWSDIAMMFQASQSSFNPVKKVRMDFIDTARAHDMKWNEEEIIARSRELLGLVMLDGDRVLNSYPHELSGGMKQRALLALSLLLEPRLIILDEPTTALDLLTQDKIVLLLNRLKKRYGFSYLFITHDLSIVTELADTVAVMYGGKIVEVAPVRELFKDPRHPYSDGLIRAIPRLSLESTELSSIPGSPPDLVELNSGCPFADRCPRRLDRCITEMPPLESDGEPSHRFACWNPLKGDA